MPINRPVIIYISAASDLMAEREALARLIAALPVTLAWRILQTPLKAEILDLAVLQKADIYVLVMGGDIRAPVGLEWRVAQQTGRSSVAFLKRGIPRTPAGQNFSREAGALWQLFADATDLRRQAQQMLVEHLLTHALDYGLTPIEVEQLQALQRAGQAPDQPTTSQDAGRSAVILSPERFEPSEGILLEKTVD